MQIYRFENPEFLNEYVSVFVRGERAFKKYRL